MKVRELQETDLKKLLLLYRHLHENDEEPNEEKLFSIWRKIKNNDSFIYYVIEIDEEIVCSCNLTIIPNLTRGGRAVGLIDNVVTHPSYRKKGLGKTIGTAVERAKINECYKVMLMSNSKRKEAHAFYERIGFNSKDKVGFFMKLP